MVKEELETTDQAVEDQLPEVESEETAETEANDAPEDEPEAAKLPADNLRDAREEGFRNGKREQQESGLS